jgi:hypothetical protein
MYFGAASSRVGDLPRGRGRGASVPRVKGWCAEPSA